MRFLGLAASMFVICLGACSRSGDAAGTASASSADAARAESVDGTERAPANKSVVVDFLAAGPSCTFGHRGILFDLGDATMRTRMSGARLAPLDVEMREREGATWIGVRSRSLELSFVAPPDFTRDAGVVVEARVRGGIAKSASLYLNGKSLSVLPLTRGETKIVTARAPNATIPKGASELLIRFNGGARGSRDELAEIDWIRIGAIDDDAPYAAPTRSDAIATVSAGGVAYRSVSLRAPGFARCSGFIPNGATLETKLGVTGGEADAEVRVLVDRAEPRVVGSFHLTSEGGAVWRSVALPLGDLDTIAAVELVAKSSTKGARVVFGEPRVVIPAAAAPQPTVSRGVIVVVFGSLSPKTISPYGGVLETTELAELANSGTVFEAHRAPTSFASGAVASMLTGLSPREHGAEGPGGVLPPNALTIAQAARQAGIQTAMFTTNVTTSSAFGFARGWETFSARMPNEDGASTAIFDDVAEWLDAHRTDRFLVFVHARGGHPPWEVPAEELKDLPPAGYAGALDPKRAGEMLAKAQRTPGSARLFTDADRTRAFALEGRAVLAQDAALGRLVARVKGLGRDADTTWIITGDVGVDSAARVPFIEDDNLDEASLSLPLIVRSPEPPNVSRRSRVKSPTTSMDVAHTVLEAFGLSPPAQLRGENLLAHLSPDTSVRPLFATTTTRFSLRWGNFVFGGTSGREGKLCDLSLDANCLSDIRPTHPIAAELAHSRVFDALSVSSVAAPAMRPDPDAMPRVLRIKKRY